MNEEPKSVWLPSAFTHYTLPAAALVALLHRVGNVDLTTDEVRAAEKDVPRLRYEDHPTGPSIYLEDEPMKTGSVYVRMTQADQTLSARQRTFEAPNGVVVLDYDANGALLGVEVCDALQVDWNGKPMPLPGGAE